MATLASAYIREKGLWGSAPVRLMTFGSPRVGASDFALRQNQLVGYSYRVVYKRDIVAHLPWCQVRKVFGKQFRWCRSDVNAPYHNGFEVWYKDNWWFDGTNFETCFGLPYFEDKKCSNNIFWGLGYNVDDHTGYWLQNGAQTFSDFDIKRCPMPLLPKDASLDPNFDLGNITGTPLAGPNGTCSRNVFNAWLTANATADDGGGGAGSLRPGGLAYATALLLSLLFAIAMRPTL